MRYVHGCFAGRALLCNAASAYITVIERRGAKDGAEQRASGKGIIMNMARSFSNWRKYRQTVNELSRMNARELRDLGINPSEIKTVARAAVGF